MKSNSVKHTIIKVRSGIKAGGFGGNHSRRSVGVAVKSGVKAGDGIPHANHSRGLSSTVKAKASLKVKAGIKAGGFGGNHSRRSVGVAVKSGVRAGAGIPHANHNRGLSSAAKAKSSLKVKAGIKAGGFGGNHNRNARGIAVKAGVKAGGFGGNHNRRAQGIVVKSGIKAGDGIHHANHNRRIF